MIYCAVVFSIVILLVTFTLTSYYYYITLRRIKRRKEPRTLYVCLIPASLGFLLPMVYLFNPIMFSLMIIYAGIYAFSALIVIAIKGIICKEKVIFHELVFHHESKVYKVRVLKLQAPYAYSKIFKGEIYVTAKLKEILNPEELNSVVLHEIGHLKSRMLKFLSALVEPFWLMILPFSVASLTYSLGRTIVEFNLDYALAFIFTLTILYSAGILVTIVSWLYEHQADLYAVKRINPEIFAKALVKHVACLRLKELCNVKCLEHITPPKIKEITFTDIAKALAKTFLSLPLTIKDLMKRQTYQTHPPLHLRLYVILHVNV